MTRTLLNSMSTLEIVLLGVGGMAALTIVGVLLARRCSRGSPTASSSPSPTACGSSMS